MKCTLFILALFYALPGFTQSHSDRLESVKRSNNQALIYKSAFAGDTFELLRGNNSSEKRVDANGKIVFKNIGSGPFRIKKIGRNLYENAASQVSITAVSGKKKKTLFTGNIPALEKGVALKMPYKGSVVVEITDAH